MPMHSRPSTTSRRVAMVIDTTTTATGRIRGQARQLADALRRCGHQVDLLSGGGRVWHDHTRLRQQLHAGHYDLVHVHAPRDAAWAWQVIDDIDVPCVATRHTPEAVADGAIRLTWRERAMLPRYAAVLCDSVADGAAVTAESSVPCHVVPEGIDLQQFRPDLPRPESLPHDRRHVLFLGTGAAHDGLTVLREAMRHLRRFWQFHDVHLVVIGSGPWVAWHRWCSRSDSSVHYLDVPEPLRAHYMAHADVYACPAARPAGDDAMREVMACATPIVCTEQASAADAYTFGRGALLVPDGHVHALADGLARVLDDAALSYRLRVGGRRAAYAFAWPAIAERVQTIYAQALGECDSPDEVHACDHPVTGCTPPAVRSVAVHHVGR